MMNVKRRAFVPRKGEHAAWKSEVHINIIYLGKMNTAVSVQPSL